MTLTNEEIADAQIKLFEKLTSYSLQKKGSVFLKTDLEKIGKKYLQKVTKFDELPPNSLYLIYNPEDVRIFWAQYYPSGFESTGATHRWATMGGEKISYDKLSEDEDGTIDGWDMGSEFYLFTPPLLENKPFLNWEQNNPWEVKE